MTWRLHLTNQAIQALDILEGKPRLLAVWSRQDRVAFYDLDSGTALGEKVLPAPPATDRLAPPWLAYLAGLTAPNGAFFPLVRTPSVIIHQTDDGRMHLYQENRGGTGGLFLASEGKEIRLDTGSKDDFIALALDRFLGLSAALAEDGRLHVYQQHIHVGAFDLGLTPERGITPAVTISRGGGAIFASDGQRLAVTDTSGKVRQRIETPYTIGKMACSPDGQYVLTSDTDSGVLRVYAGADLALLRQRFAVDLIAHAAQVQLMADPPPYSVAISALKIDQRGVIAFAMSGVICVSAMTELDALPRPQVLL